MSAREGKRWNNERRVWVVENLEEEAAHMPPDDEDILERARERAKNSEAAASSAGRSRGAGPAETGDYEALGVAPSATQAEIKRAYYFLARQLHPDKNPDDPHAKAKFQAIGEAYQVLSSDELRARYDASGKDGLGETEFADTSAFFAALFGSDKFEPLVGRLDLATMAMAGARLACEAMATQLVLRTVRRCGPAKVGADGAASAARGAHRGAPGRDTRPIPAG